MSKRSFFSLYYLRYPVFVLGLAHIGFLTTPAAAIAFLAGILCWDCIVKPLILAGVLKVWDE